MSSDTDMEAISAMESITKNMPKQTTRNIHIPPAGPPLLSGMPMMLHGTGLVYTSRYRAARFTYAKAYSQVLPRMTA